MRDLISISYLFKYTVLWKLPDFSSLTFLLELTFRCLYLELCSFGTNGIALCCIRQQVELIHTSKAIVSQLYVKAHDFTISLPEEEFCKRDYKGRSGHEVAEPLPQINWLKSMNLKGNLGERPERGDEEKRIYPTSQFCQAWLGSCTSHHLVDCRVTFCCLNLPTEEEHDSEQKPGVRLIGRTIWESREEASRALGEGLIGSKVHRTGLAKLSKFAQEVAKRENKQRGAGWSWFSGSTPFTWAYILSKRSLAGTSSVEKL